MWFLLERKFLIRIRFQLTKHCNISMKITCPLFNINKQILPIIKKHPIRKCPGMHEDFEFLDSNAKQRFSIPGLNWSNQRIGCENITIPMSNQNYFLLHAFRPNVPISVENKTYDIPRQTKTKKWYCFRSLHNFFIVFVFTQILIGVESLK